MATEIQVSGTWAILLTQYLSWLESSDTSKTTIKLHSYHLRRFAAAVAMKPEKVKLKTLTDFLASEDWSGATKRSYQTTFKSFFGWAKLQHHTKKNPAKNLPTIHVPPGVPRPADEQSVRAGIEVQDRRVRLMIRLAAQAGLRCCEIAVVHTDDLVRDLVGYSLIVHGKGNKTRIVPLNPSLAAELANFEHGYVFPGRIDGHLSAGYVSKLISRALPPQVTGHPLRHRFASIAYEGSGGDIRAVQELLGHASVATTQIYTRVPDGAKRRGVLAAA